MIVLFIFDIHLHHKLDTIILQQKYFIATSSSSNPNCSELSSLGQRSLITTLKFDLHNQRTLLVKGQVSSVNRRDEQRNNKYKSLDIECD